MLFKDLMTYKRILIRHIYTSVISWWFSAYWVGLMVLCWRLIFSSRIAGQAVVAWSSRASEIFFPCCRILEFGWVKLVRGGSSGGVRMSLWAWVADFNKSERWRTIGLWSVGGPGCDLSAREGYHIAYFYLWEVLLGNEVIIIDGDFILAL